MGKAFKLSEIIKKIYISKPFSAQAPLIETNCLKASHGSLEPRAGASALSRGRPWAGPLAVLQRPLYLEGISQSR